MPMRVVVDAGHGGFDNGAMYEGRREKDENLELALLVGDLLRNKGVDVIFTRTDDIYQNPNLKASLGNEAGGDLFVSIHRNSSPTDNQYHGVETLVYNLSDAKETVANQINQKLSEVGYQNLGVKARPDLAVLRRTNIPAVLVEAGFINSDIDNALFDEKFYQTAEAIAQGIFDGLNQIAQPSVPVRYIVQAGLFRQYNNALELQNKLIEEGYPAQIQYKSGLYAVEAGVFSDYAEAQRVANAIRSSGGEAIILRE